MLSFFARGTGKQRSLHAVEEESASLSDGPEVEGKEQDTGSRSDKRTPAFELWGLAWFSLVG